MPLNSHCPGLGSELVLYIEAQDRFRIEPLAFMGKGSVLRDAKLSLIVIAGLDGLALGKGVLKLRELVKRVDYGVDDEPFDWDTFPGKSGGDKSG